MHPAHQPIWKLDTMFLALATAVLIFSWMAHPRDGASGSEAVARLASPPSASRP